MAVLWGAHVPKNQQPLPGMRFAGRRGVRPRFTAPDQEPGAHRQGCPGCAAAAGVAGAQCPLGCLGQVLPSDLRQSTQVSLGWCLDLAALVFRDPLLDTVGQTERWAGHPQLLALAGGGGPTQPTRLPVGEAEPPKTEVVQTSGAHMDTLLLTHFCSSSRWRGADTSLFPGVCGTCREPWRIRPVVPMGGHVIAVGHFHVFLPQSKDFCLLRCLCLEKTCLASLQAPPGL